MALLKFQKNICGINHQTYVYLSANPTTNVIWDDCNNCRHAGTVSSSMSRGASTESTAQSKQTTSNNTTENNDKGANQKGYGRLKSTISNIKFPTVQVNVNGRIAEMNKYVTSANEYISGAFSRNIKPSSFNLRRNELNKNSNNNRDDSDFIDESSVYSLEKTITKMNQSVLSYYDSTYVDENLQAVKASEVTMATETQTPARDYLDDDFSNVPSPQGPSFPAYPDAVEDKKKKAQERRAEKISRLSLESRTKALVQGLKSAFSLMSRASRLEELCDHLIAHPECVYEASNENIMPTLFKLAESPDKNVRAMAYQALSLMGFVKPLKAPGLRILSIDGGGTRGVVAIEFLKALEKQTGKRIYELFDYVCGVSTGALLASMLVLYKLPLDQCEMLYKRSSIKTFTRNKVVGTTRLVWNHGFYDSKLWEGILRKEMGSTPLIEFSRDPEVPKMSAVSAKVSSTGMVNYLFRNYNLPPGVKSQYPGCCKHKIWQVIRASSAAPGYFKPFHIGKDVHEDGGILSNNPTALAIHESRLLWEKEGFHCIVSLGTGRHEAKMEMSKLSLKRKINTIVDSACDTEAVHHTLSDLLPSNTYFRFNPYLSEEFFLDEIRPEKLEQMQKDARLYNRRNSSKLSRCSERLLQTRSHKQRVTDWVKQMVGRVSS